MTETSTVSDTTKAVFLLAAEAMNRLALLAHNDPGVSPELSATINDWQQGLASCDWPILGYDTSDPPATCKHCGRSITQVDGAYVDPEATGDDAVWRATCDSHDTPTAEHEPAESVGPLKLYRVLFENGDEVNVMAFDRDDAEHRTDTPERGGAWSVIDMTEFPDSEPSAVAAVETEDLPGITTARTFAEGVDAMDRALTSRAKPWPKELPMPLTVTELRDHLRSHHDTEIHSSDPDELWALHAEYHGNAREHGWTAANAHVHPTGNHMREKQPMVAVVGDLVHGFTFFGPIDEDDRDNARAIAWLEANEDVLIVPLRPLPPVEDLEAGRVGRTATNA